MKKLVKIIVILAILGVIGAVYGWFFVYNKPHRNFEKAKPDMVLTAEDCYQAFADEDSSYLGKVLQLSGIPASIEKQDSLVIVVFVFNQGMFGDEGIRCTMLPTHNEEALALSTDKEINIKGKCQGYNGTDVILEHCSLVIQ